MVPIKRAKRRHLRDAIFGQRGKGEQKGKEIQEQPFEDKKLAEQMIFRCPYTSDKAERERANLFVLI